jgi:prophage antirepressor-like protein
MATQSESLSAGADEHRPGPLMSRDGSSATAEKELWDELQHARMQNRADAIADVEDRLFRHYQPLVRDLVASDPDSVRGRGLATAAEGKLFEAILAWRHRDGADFESWVSRHVMADLRSSG